VAILLFLAGVDSWSIPQLSSVFLVGITLSLFPVSLLLLTSDKHALGKESEAIGREASTTSPGIQNAENNDQFGNEALLLGNLAKKKPAEEERPRCCNRQYCIGRKAVPLLLLLGDIIRGFASGMTIKFFPLFFKNAVRISPVMVNLVTILAMLGIMGCTRVIRVVAYHAGRMQACFAFTTIGISLLVAMGALRDYWTYPWVICPIYILRTSVMNCQRPLTKSVLMDLVPKASRARWNSLDSLTRFGWSGSAFLGGWLVDRGGYGFTFFITAGLSFTGALPWLIIAPLVPQEQLQERSQGRRE